MNLRLVLLTGRMRIFYDKIRETTTEAPCCSCNIFPKFKIFWDPPFISFLLSSLVLFDVCSRHTFMPMLFYGLYWLFALPSEVFETIESEMQLIALSPLQRSNKKSGPIQGSLVPDMLYLFFFISGCIKIPSERFVSTFSAIPDDVLQSSSMVVLSSSDSRRFDSQILRLSTFAIAALESTILPM